MARAKKKKPGPLFIFIIFIAVAVLTYFILTKLTGIRPGGPVSTHTPIATPTTTPPAATDSNQLNQTTAADFQLAGINLQTTAEELTNLFGDPLTVKKTSQVSFQNPNYLIYLQTWVYPDLEVLFMNHAAKGEAAPVMPGVILTITVNSDLYPTARGIQVGAPLEQLLDRYGRIKPDGDSYTYNSDQNYLEFTVKDAKVTSISVGQNLD